MRLLPGKSFRQVIIVNQFAVKMKLKQCHVHSLAVPPSPYLFVDNNVRLNVGEDEEAGMFLCPTFALQSETCTE